MAMQTISALLVLTSLVHSFRVTPKQGRPQVDRQFRELPHISELAAHADNFEDWQAAVLRNAQSFIEENATELEAAGDKPTWPSAWTSKLKAKAHPIGKGAFGKVYLATVACDESHVAIKAMTAKQSEVDTEAGLLKAFSHDPNFVAYHDHQSRPGRRSSIHYIMMEAAMGKTLGHIIDGRKPANKASKYQLFYDALQGVKYMHDKGVVHRDLKPANIFISRTCDVPGNPRCASKVGDLGLSCQKIGAPVHPSVPKCKGFGGTPLYIAPETYGSQTIDPKNDVWALGLMLYELTFGRLPAAIENSRTMKELERNVINFVITSDVLFNKHPEGTIKRLLRGMLTRALNSRLSSASALDMAVDLNLDSDSRPIASLPECYATGKKPTKPNPLAESIKDDVDALEAEGDVGYFTLANPMSNIAVNFLFQAELVDPSTGMVVGAAKKIADMHRKSFFPKALKPGYQILEINDKAWSSITRSQQEGLKQGLYGSVLNIKYRKK